LTKLSLASRACTSALATKEKERRARET
jgi:hypothetical protein